MKSAIKVALAGNPNAGKTSIFNRLTGASQCVANYPGVTVEKKEGCCRHRERDLTVVDLPGTYSLTAYSIEERTARHFILEEKPDVVVDILDAVNLERNLFLATQLMELDVPLVFALNMSDAAEARGIRFDVARLSQLLGVPIVPTVGNKGIGISDLLDAVVGVVDGSRRSNPARVVYRPETEQELSRLQAMLGGAEVPGTRWQAIKLLENDPDVKASEPVRLAAQAAAGRLEKLFGANMETIIAERRYGFISGACSEAVVHTVEARHTISDSFDQILIHPVAGLPIFLGLMYVVFQLTFTAGAPFVDALEALFQWFGARVHSFWPEGADSLLRSLLVDGIISGVGAVVVFLPNIVFLFLAIALMEDSGYMARAAFIMDRWMHRIGLHGKSFIPMLIGFGCTVPAVMATRMLETRRDRLITMLILPLISCGARLPIYALIIPAFFPPAWRAPILWLIYFVGIFLAVVGARFLRATLFRGETAPFVMELPPYRLPTFRSIGLHVWERSSQYLRKAGTVILGFSVLLWVLSTFPRLPEEAAPTDPVARMEAQLSHSALGQIGRGLEPLIRPMGFDWRLGTAMLGAFAAKEIFVAQLGIVYAVGDAEHQSDTLRAKLRLHYRPLNGFCIMLFMLIGLPCMATVAVTQRESHSWRWPLFQLCGLTALAYVLTTLVYQLGRLLGL